jgi:hypothetical protein
MLQMALVFVILGRIKVALYDTNKKLDMWTKLKATKNKVKRDDERKQSKSKRDEHNSL